MSLFDSQFDIESVVAGKQFATEFDFNKNSHNNNLNYNSLNYGPQAVHASVIPASPLDIYDDLLEFQEVSMNLEVIINAFLTFCFLPVD